MSILRSQTQALFCPLELLCKSLGIRSKSPYKIPCILPSWLSRLSRTTSLCFQDPSLAALHLMPVTAGAHARRVPLWPQSASATSPPEQEAPLSGLELREYRVCSWEAAMGIPTASNRSVPRVLLARRKCHQPQDAVVGCTAMDVRILLQICHLICPKHRLSLSGLTICGGLLVITGTYDTVNHLNRDFFSLCAEYKFSNL